MVPLPVAAGLLHQVGLLLLLALAIGCMSWTVTHEEVFREPREYCKRKSPGLPVAAATQVLLPVHLRVLLQPLCHAIVLFCTRFSLLYVGWRGYVLAEFALVFAANMYMGLYNRMRLTIKHENVSIEVEQQQVPKV